MNIIINNINQIQIKDTILEIGLKKKTIKIIKRFTEHRSSVQVRVLKIVVPIIIESRSLFLLSDSRRLPMERLLSGGILLTV